MAGGEIDVLYKQYLLSDNREIVIRNLKYYKAVYIQRCHSGVFNGRIKAILPYEMFGGNPLTPYVMCDKGFSFRIHGPEHFSFREGIPEWYFQCGSFFLDFIDDKMAAEDETDIGHYFTPVDEICKKYDC